MFMMFYCGLDSRMEGGYRSAWQECALIVSLEIFNILLERCNGLLKEQLDSKTNSLPSNRLLGEDLQIILPAIKVTDSFIEIIVFIYSWIVDCY